MSQGLALAIAACWVCIAIGILIGAWWAGPERAVIEDLSTLDSLQAKGLIEIRGGRPVVTNAGRRVHASMGRTAPEPDREDAATTS